MQRLLMIRILLITTAVATAGVGCRARFRAAPSLSAGTTLWCWSITRTSLPPESVSVRLARAFTSAGLTGAATLQLGDTAWVHAGPSPLSDFIADVRFEARAEAFRQADSTRVRYEVGIAPPAGAWSAFADTTAAKRRGSALCSEIGR